MIQADTYEYSLHLGRERKVLLLTAFVPDHGWLPPEVADVCSGLDLVLVGEHLVFVEIVLISHHLPSNQALLNGSFSVNEKFFSNMKLAC